MSEAQEKPEGVQNIPLQVEEPAPTPSETPVDAQATTTPVNDNEIKVFSAPVASTSTSTSNDINSSHPSEETSKETDPDLPDAFFEPSIQDAQSYHATVISRSKRLNEAPLLTSKHRDEDRLLREKKKAEKWPTTTIRVKFSDGTQIQSTFASTSAIQPVYAFVRNALKPEYASKTFNLWQPPRFTYPEHPIPQPKKSTTSKTIIQPANYGYVRGGPAAGLMGGKGGKESLNDLGLVPQSVLMVKWDDESMNVTGYPAPLLEELMEKVVPLPAAEVKEGEVKKQPPAGASGSGGATGEKKIPKWLQKGLMKRK